ncbi:MAG TPA: hypothetical protein VKE69_12115 [Planctomycetota bacterium]|nr:hypothetical protein [Planctomycetota bacterium]
MKVFLALVLAPIGCLALVILLALGAGLCVGVRAFHAVAGHPIEIVVDSDAPGDAIDQVLAHASIGGRNLHAIVRVDDRRGHHDRSFVRIWTDDRQGTQEARASIRTAIDELERSGAFPRGAVTVEGELQPSEPPRRIAR